MAIMAKIINGSNGENNETAISNHRKWRGNIENIVIMAISANGEIISTMAANGVKIGENMASGNNNGTKCGISQ
jgi:hypothetical protein